MTCVKAQSQQLLESAIADNTCYRNREEFGVTLTREPWLCLCTCIYELVLTQPCGGKDIWSKCPVACIHLCKDTYTPWMYPLGGPLWSCKKDFNIKTTISKLCNDKIHIFKLQIFRVICMHAHLTLPWRQLHTKKSYNQIVSGIPKGRQQKCAVTVIIIIIIPAHCCT